MNQPATLSSSTRPEALATAAVARNCGLDALKAALTLLVVLHHCAITYGGSGGWFYRELPSNGSPSSLLLTLFCATNQAYFMGLFFLLAGYHTPASIARRGVANYLGERALRLGLPLLLFGFVLGPMTVALERASSPQGFVAGWAQLMSEGVFINGPLWFAQALLMLAPLAVLAGRLLPAPRRAAQRAFPTNATLLLAALATGLAALALRQLWPVGVNVWGLQLGYFASYLLLFAAGCWAAQGRLLERVPAPQQRRWGLLSLLALPVLPVALLLAKGAGSFAGGWNAVAALYAFWEPLLAWGVILSLLRWFQQRFARLSTLGQKLVRRAYTIFIIHPPVLVGVALAWANVPAPALLKFTLTGLLSCWLCYLIAGALLRLPGAQRVL